MRPLSILKNWLWIVLQERLEGYLQLLRQTLEKHAKAHKEGPDRYKLTPENLNFGLKYCPDLTRSMNYLLATGNLVSTTGLGLMQVLQFNYGQYLVNTSG